MYLFKCSVIRISFLTCVIVNNKIEVLKFGKIREIVRNYFRGD